MSFFMNAAEFGQLRAGARVLEADRFGEKVLQLPDDRIVKLFRTRRWWSSAMLYPYSLRFQRNSERLAALGFITVRVQRVFYCAAIARHGVIYARLEGESLERLLRDAGPEPESALLERFGALVARLHERGVYFRSVHLGNILRLPDGELGLIDMAQTFFRGSPLSGKRRVRNIEQMLRPSAHEALWTAPRRQAFLAGYGRGADLPDTLVERLRAALALDGRG